MLDTQAGPEAQPRRSGIARLGKDGGPPGRPRCGCVVRVGAGLLALGAAEVEVVEQIVGRGSEADRQRTPKPARERRLQRQFARRREDIHVVGKDEGRIETILSQVFGAAIGGSGSAEVAEPADGDAVGEPYDARALLP